MKFGVEVRNGTLPRSGLGLRGGQQPSQAVSDSDSWMESSRSRETSPSSSIPPSLPAFRVIPLCESESSGTHLSDPPLLPPFPRSSRFMPTPLSSIQCNLLSLLSFSPPFQFVKSSPDMSDLMVFQEGNSNRGRNSRVNDPLSLLPPSSLSRPT